MMANSPMSDNDQRHDARLNELFLTYRDACPDREPSVNFGPQLWARIEARENANNWFGQIAKGLVTAALAASAVIALLISSNGPSASFINGNLVDAMAIENVAQMEPFHVDRIIAVERERE